MKNTSLITLSLAFCTVASINAYEFSFYNNTEKPTAIAIQYTGNDGIKEPLYKQLVKPQSMVTFSPGQKGIPEIKWGFCLDQIYYVESPTQEQKNKNFEKAPWRKIAITWVEEKSTTKQTQSKRIKKQNRAVTKSTKETTKGMPYSAKATKGTPAEKSRCRDRHFDITRNEQNKIIVTSSLAE
jgi:hypothetical protein